MPRNLATSALIKPFVVLALPGMYLFYKYNQYKRQQQEQTRRKVTERELAHLNHKIDKLLCKLEENEPEMATSQEDECVICVNARATMQTFPCSHRVVCRKCFVKTIQMAVSQRLLPLRCVICRSKILRLKQGVSGGVVLPTSASQYYMQGASGSGTNKWDVPASASLYSMSSGASSLSGMSSVSSATNSSQGSARSSKSGGRLGYRQPSGSSLRRSQTQQMKMRIQEYKDPLAVAGSSAAASTSGASTSSAGSTAAPPERARLPPIQEFQREFRASRDKPTPKEKPSTSTRIRCAQKLVTQLENPPPPKKSSISYFRSRSPLKGAKVKEPNKRKEEKTSKAGKQDKDAKKD